MPISWTDANVLMIGSSTGGETFRFGGRVHGIDRVALPSHRRQSSASARTRPGQANSQCRGQRNCPVHGGRAASLSDDPTCTSVPLRFVRVWVDRGEKSVFWVHRGWHESLQVIFGVRALDLLVVRLYPPSALLALVWSSGSCTRLCLAHMRTQRSPRGVAWFTVVAGKGTRCHPCTPLGSRLRTPWRRKPCQRTR